MITIRDMRAPACTAAILLFTAAPGAVAQTNFRYRLTDLGDFGILGPNEPEGVNDSVQVVGWQVAEWERTPTGLTARYHGFRWEDGIRSDLAPLGVGRSCWVNAINDWGLAVGATEDENGAVVACTFDPATNDAVPLAVAGATLTAASAISNAGVVGGAATVDGRQHVPFLLDLKSGAVRFLVEIEGRGTVAAVNDSGTAVAQVTDSASVLRLYLVPDGQTPIELNSLLPPNSSWRLTSIADINSAGDIVGNGLYSGQMRAFCGRFAGADPRVLDPLAGDLETYASAISDDGAVGGQSYYFDLPAARWTGVIWTDRTAENVNSLTANRPAGLWFEGVREMNNRGHLAVRGVRNGVRQYLLSPVCWGDFNYDGHIDNADLALLLGCFGASGCPHDLSDDGRADLQDLALLLAAFGEFCP